MNTFYRVNASSRHTDKRWKEKDTAEIGISFGQAFHEGRKFESLLLWACQRFDSVIITLSDTLYRHNYVLDGNSAETAVNIARNTGDFWLARNKKTIRKCSNANLAKISIHRWDSYIKTAEYKAIARDLAEFHECNEHFRRAVRQDIQRFLERNKSDLSRESDRFFQVRKSRDYILEETAAYIYIARRFESARLYPGLDLEALKFMRRGDTPEHLKGLEQSPHVKLSFHRKAAPSGISERKAA